jgi:hypothetical protein
LAPLNASSWTLGSIRPTHNCVDSVTRAAIKHCTASVERLYSCKRFKSWHGVAGTVSGVEAAIHGGDELWFGVGIEVSERDQNLAIDTWRNGPGTHLESTLRWVLISSKYSEFAQSCSKTVSPWMLRDLLWLVH